MLLQVTIENFLSFREATTFSLLANNSGAFGFLQVQASSTIENIVTTAKRWFQLASAPDTPTNERTSC